MRTVALLPLVLLTACSNNAERDLDPLVPDLGVRETGSGFDATLDVAEVAPGCAHGHTAAKRIPVDLIFAIDQSESMDGQIAQVKKNINKLTDLLGKTKLDYRVVMIARPGPDTFGVCIPPPLGADGCGDNLPYFKRSAQQVMSNDALELFLKTYDSTDTALTWAKYIRFDSLKAFVPITDDNATRPPPAPYWQTFDREIVKRGAGAFGTAKERNYVFFPIIGAVSGTEVTTTKCATDVVSEGPEYQELAKLTGGAHFAVCANDYGPTFIAMGTSIAARALCTMPVPMPPAGETLDPTKVNVSFTPPGKPTTDLFQDSSKPCNEGANGWQYSADKTKILLCGDACKQVAADPETRVDVDFGCVTRIR